MLAQYLNVAIGIWLMAAPYVIGYDGAAANNHFIIGPIVATIAGIAVSEVARPLRWLNLPLGLWLAICPIILSYPALGAVNTVACGLLIAICSCIRGQIKHKIGGGWRMLWSAPDASSIA